MWHWTKMDQYYNIPNSWGTSWQNIAMEVLIPPNFPDGQSAEKAAPIANPSKKLWSASPRRIIQTTDLNDFIGIAFLDITDKSVSPSLSFWAVLFGYFYKECTKKVLKTISVNIWKPCKHEL